MIRRVSRLILIVPLLLVVLSPGLVQAGSGLAVTSSSAEVDFPAGINFTVSAESDVNITDIRLHYTVDRMAHAQVTSEVCLEFEPDTVVDAEWFWDMRKTGGLPPGSRVNYWWTVENARGDRIRTEPVEVWIRDNRHDWHGLTRGKITLYWYQGSISFADELMTTAHQVLARLAADTGVELERAVKIYIYANQQDLLESMIFPQEWTGGGAFTRYGIIIVSIAPEGLDWGRRVIAHELTHLVVHQMNFNPYGDLPTWLDEGLAMYAEGELEPLAANLLQSRAKEGNLISVRSLSSPFSAYTKESILAYAQSYSLVKFLIDNYGQEKMYQLLCAFKEGSDYDDALVSVYGFDMDGLDSLWRDYVDDTLVNQPKIGLPIHGWMLFVLIFGSFLFVVAVILLWYYERLGIYRS